MDKQKADELIFSYIRKIFGFAMLKLSKIDEAEELAAEITFQVYSSLLRQDTVENPDGYIFRIAQNVYVRHIDVKKLTASVDGIEYLPDSNDFTLDILNSESYGILRREITYLSKIQREIIVQHYFHDKKVREIAAMLSLNENTVKWHLTCSRKELKQVWNRQEQQVLSALNRSDLLIWDTAVNPQAHGIHLTICRRSSLRILLMRHIISREA